MFTGAVERVMNFVDTCDRVSCSFEWRRCENKVMESVKRWRFFKIFSKLWSFKTGWWNIPVFVKKSPMHDPYGAFFQNLYRYVSLLLKDLWRSCHFWRGQVHRILQGSLQLFKCFLYRFLDTSLGKGTNVLQFWASSSTLSIVLVDPNSLAGKHVLITVNLVTCEWSLLVKHGNSSISLKLCRSGSWSSRSPIVRLTSSWRMKLDMWRLSGLVEDLIKCCGCNISGTWFVGVTLVVAVNSEFFIVTYWSFCCSYFLTNFGLSKFDLWEENVSRRRDFDDQQYISRVSILTKILRIIGARALRDAHMVTFFFRRFRDVCQLFKLLRQISQNPEQIWTPCFR